MRIALITDGIWPYVLGGMQKHSYYLCKYLARQKIHVHLIHFNQSAYDIEKLEFFSAEEKAFIRQTLVPFPPAGKLPGHYLRNSRRYAKLVYETLKPEWQSFDFIYTKGFTGWQLLKEKRKGTPLPPVGIKFHGYEMFQKAPDLKTRLQHIFLLRRPARTLSLQADLVFSYGGKITDIIRSLGVPATRIAEIPSGVETEFIAGATAPVTRPLKFIFLGRYERRKGLEELFSALEQLQPKGCEFHIVGPIPENKKSALGIIRYHGEIRQREKVLSLLRSSDVLVCPSWSEGMPNVILEAMSQGLAVLATDTGATSVLVNGSTGWLISSPEVPRLKAAIEEIISSPPSLILEKKAAALTMIRSEFTWETLIFKLIQSMRSVVK